MAIVLSTRFNEGNWTGPWTSTTVSSPAVPKIGYGIDDLGSTACAFGSGGSFTDFNLAHYSALATGAVRMQIGILADRSFQTDYPYFVNLRSFQPAGTISPPFAALISFGLGVRDNGALRLFLPNANFAGTSTFVDSAAGVVPLDGTIHGVQLSFAIALDAGSLAYTVAFDDVVVLTGTFIPDSTGLCGGWGAHVIGHGADCTIPTGWIPINSVDNFDMAHYRSPLCGPIHVMSNIAEVVFDSNPSIISYPASNAPQIGVNTCFTPANITGLACSDGDLVITGTDFSLTGTIVVTDAYGNPISFSVGSRSSTTITLTGLTPALVDGAGYCATITNPCI